MRQKDGAPLHRLPRPQAFHSNRSGKNLITIAFSKICC
jgi:hypothetical protein